MTTSRTWKRPNPPPTKEELYVLAMRGYVEVWTTGDGIQHHGVHDKLSVSDGGVCIDREVMPIKPIPYIRLDLKV
jgi:hypothetical protein